MGYGEFLSRGRMQVSLRTELRGWKMELWTTAGEAVQGWRLNEALEELISDQLEKSLRDRQACHRAGSHQPGSAMGLLSGRPHTGG